VATEEDRPAEDQRAHRTRNLSVARQNPATEGLPQAPPRGCMDGMTTIELPDGAVVEFLTPVEGGAVRDARHHPPRRRRALHSHADPETFLMRSGEIEGYGDDGWTRIGAGDVHHIPGHVRHAWRNRFSEPAVMYLVSTATIGRFFQDVVGKDLDEFLAISDRYGYWNATPEENAAIGLTVPAPARP
jgi:quercetin dioxygenase-like cupin family protein